MGVLVQVQGEEVGDLTGVELVATVDGTAQDETGVQPAGELDEEQDPVGADAPLLAAGMELAQGGGVDVVVHDRGHTQLRTQALGEGEACPHGHEVGLQDGAATTDPSGGGGCDGAQRPVAAQPGDQAPDGVVDGLQALLGA